MFAEHPDDWVPPARRGGSGLWIEGEFFNHSAAKFWPRLIDEVQEIEPDCDGIILSAHGDYTLKRNILFPCSSLEKDWLCFERVDLRELWSDVITQLNLLETVEWTSIRLVKNGVELAQRPFPSEYLDGDTFPYLLVWLLEWAGICEKEWEREHLCGKFDAEDFCRELRYSVRFELRQRHLHEGLYERSVCLEFQREPAG